MNPKMYQLNPTADIHWQHEGGDTACVLSVATTQRTFRINDDVLDALFFCCPPRSREEILAWFRERGVAEATAREIIADMIEREILVEELDPAIMHWIDRGWRTALQFHLMTRNAAFADVVGSDSEGARLDVANQILEEGNVPELFKRYPDSPRVQLPHVEMREVSTADVMLARRTSRSFRGPRATLDELATTLKYACCVPRKIRRDVAKGLSADPTLITLSSYIPFEVYVATNGIEGLPDGVHHYDMEDHAMSQLTLGDFRADLRRCAIGQGGVDECSAVVLISAIFSRYMWRYRHSRHLRHLYSDAGAMAHRVILAAGGAGLKNFLTPALRDSEIDALTGVDGQDEVIMYLVGLGH